MHGHHDLLWGGGALTLVLIGCAVALWRSYLRARARVQTLGELPWATLSLEPKASAMSGLPVRVRGTVLIRGGQALLSPVTGKRCALVELAWRHNGRPRSLRLGGPPILSTDHVAVRVDPEASDLVMPFGPVPPEAEGRVRRLCEAPPLDERPRYDPYRGLFDQAASEFFYRELAEGEALVAIGVLHPRPEETSREPSPYRESFIPSFDLVGAAGEPALLLATSSPAPAVPRVLLPLTAVVSLLAAISTALLALGGLTS
jgi:hypothetical protein